MMQKNVLSRVIVPVLAALFLGLQPSWAAVFTVTNTNDAGAGSLRDAILQNNITPGPNVVEFDIPGQPPFVIKPQSGFLPPLRGPVVLRIKTAESANAPAAPTGAAPGLQNGGAAAAPAPRPPIVPAKPVTDIAPVVVLDGSALVKPRVLSDCPGATYNWNAQTAKWDTSDVRGQGPNVRGYYGPGLAVQDSHDVEISGVEIRDFCAGIATVRSSNVYIHDVKIVDNQGAAGIIFTGDDGHSGRTDLSFNNRVVHSVLLDNGDGFEFTRGTHDSLVQDCYIGLTKPLPEDGNAVEFASAGDGDALIGNTFFGYSDDAVTVSGNRQAIRDNLFSQNKSNGIRINAASTGLLILGNAFRNNGGIAIVVAGAGARVIDNLITGNGAGIDVQNATITLSRNSIFDNKQYGIGLVPPQPRGPARAQNASAPNSNPNPQAATGAPPAGPNAPGPAQSPAQGPNAQGPARGPAPPGLDLVPAPPTLLPASKWSPDALTLRGEVQGKPSHAYSVQIFGTPQTETRDQPASADGQIYLGTAHAVAGSNGKGQFMLPLALDDPLEHGETAGSFTATVTDEAGSTSIFSPALPMQRLTAP